MARILAIINRCKECPHRQYFSGGTYQCAKVSAYLDDREAMPEWCPLPHYPTAQPTTKERNSA